MSTENKMSTRKNIDYYLKRKKTDVEKDIRIESIKVLYRKESITFEDFFKQMIVQVRDPYSYGNFENIESDVEVELIADSTEPSQSIDSSSSLSADSPQSLHIDIQHHPQSPLQAIVYSQSPTYTRLQNSKILMQDFDDDDDDEYLSPYQLQLEEQRKITSAISESFNQRKKIIAERLELKMSLITDKDIIEEVKKQWAQSNSSRKNVTKKDKIESRRRFYFKFKQEVTDEFDLEYRKIQETESDMRLVVKKKDDRNERKWKKQKKNA